MPDNKHSQWCGHKLSTENIISIAAVLQLPAYGTLRRDAIMNFTNLQTYIIPVVLIACMVLGYILKAWIKDLDNKFIPTILTVFGAVLAGFIQGWSAPNCIYGALTGLASTGMHQLFKQYIDCNKNNGSETK